MTIKWFNLIGYIGNLALLTIFILFDFNIITIEMPLWLAIIFLFLPSIIGSFVFFYRSDISKGEITFASILIFIVSFYFCWIIFFHKKLFEIGDMFGIY
jgi:hypothetical protein